MYVKIKCSDVQTSWNSCRGVGRRMKRDAEELKSHLRHSNALHDWRSLIRGYDTTTTIQTTVSPARLAVRSTAADACRGSGFIGGGQMFKFLFTPPLKPLLWACLLAWASRDPYRSRLWFARALIPHPMCSGRDTVLSRRTHRNLAVISQSELFFFVFSPP